MPPIYSTPGDGASSDAAREDERAHRSLGTWGLLWTVWIVGIGVWAIYLVGIGFVLFRVFT